MQVTDETLAERVGQLRDLDPEVRLVLELTEGMLLGNDLPTVAALTRLRHGGVRLAIDDFGIGYSSVGYLHRLPVDVLKIDKMFVAELHDPRSRALVAGVVAMAHAMDLSVIAEGVEDWASGQPSATWGATSPRAICSADPSPSPRLRRWQPAGRSTSSRRPPPAPPQPPADRSTVLAISPADCCAVASVE